MIDLTSHIADMWTILEVGTLLKAFACIGVVLFIYNQAVTAYVSSRTAWGRRPPIDDDLRSQQKRLDDLKDRLSGLAPNEKVDELVKSLSTFATRAEVRAIEQLLPTLVTRQELREQMELIAAHVDDFSKEWRTELRAMRGESDAAREGLHRRIEALVKISFENRGTLTAIQEALRGS